MVTPAWIDGLGDVLSRCGHGLAAKLVSDGRYRQVNGALAALLDLEPAAMVGRSDAELFDVTLVPALRAADVAAAQQAGSLESEHVVERAGRRREFRVVRRRMDLEGENWLVSVWQDLGPARRQAEQLQAALQQIEAQQRAHEALRREWTEQGLRDNASGLHTRAHFEEHLRRETDLSQREHREYAIVFVALDLTGGALPEGHTQLLESLGHLMRSGTRAMDASCRWDDQRFAVLLSGVGLATAHARMEGLRRQCATQIVMHEGRQLRFTVSMGIASYPHTADGGDALLRAGEQALAEAQRRGGNQVTLASIRLDRG